MIYMQRFPPIILFGEMDKDVIVTEKFTFIYCRYPVFHFVYVYPLKT